jgi:hypothetical protein
MLVPNLIVINYPKPTTGANALTKTVQLVFDFISILYSMHVPTF